MYFYSEQEIFRDQRYTRSAIENRYVLLKLFSFSACEIIMYLFADLNKKVVCYFASWSWYRYGDGKFAPEYIDRNLCTHIVYAFASLDPNDLTITSANEWEDFENSE